MISTVPTVLQRQGVFTEAIGGRVPVDLRSGDDDAAPGGGSTRTPFPGNTIPVERIDPVARALLSATRCRRAPAPPTTTAGRDNETVDQDQFSVRVDHRFDAIATRCSAG